MTDLKQIKQMTGIKEKCADYGAQMLDILTGIKE
jgi:hypothetical protein